MKLGLICQHSGLELQDDDAEARWTIPPAADLDAPWTPLPPSVLPPAVSAESSPPPPPESGMRLASRRPLAKGKRTTTRPRAA